MVWTQGVSVIGSFVVIFRVRIAFRKTVVGGWHFDYLSGSHLQSQVKTLKMTTAQVVETSVTNNSLSKGYPHPEDHDKPINVLLITSDAVGAFKKLSLKFMARLSLNTLLGNHSSFPFIALHCKGNVISMPLWLNSPPNIVNQPYS